MDTGLTSLLSDEQREVAERVIAEESAQRRHIVIALSGAHAYGFPSPDSDLDLKAIHMVATDKLLGLAQPRLTFDRLEVIDGVEIDYTSNELGPVLLGVLGGNGNFIERILGRLQLTVSEELAELAELTQASLSRRVYKHYRGFASSQLRAVAEVAEPATKKVLYVLRTALTGAHLLATGDVVADVGYLLDDYGFGEAWDLIDAKRGGEQVTLSAADKERWVVQLHKAFEAIDAARARSVLPEEPPNVAALEAWLVRTRLADC